MSLFEVERNRAENIRLDNLSVIIITRDESINIAECLESVSFAGELIVCDSGSTDETVEIARQHGARVESISWKGFGAAKQSALKFASREWALSLDADERVTPALEAEIREALLRSDVEGFEIPRLTNFVGSWVRHSGWYPDYVLRLFKRERGRFTNSAVHEKVIVAGKIEQMRNHLLHYSYRSMDDYLRRMNRYTTLAAEELCERGEKFSIWQLLLKPVAIFFKRYWLKLGFLDGWAGFEIAALSSVYVFLKYTKFRRLSKISATKGAN